MLRYEMACLGLLGLIVNLEKSALRYLASISQEGRDVKIIITDVGLR